MKAIFKATALLGGASAINILIGLVSSKVTAVLLGPRGFGLMSLYQSILTLTVMVAGLGLPTAVTRAMALAFAGEGEHRAAVLRRASLVVTFCAAFVAMALISGFSRSLTRGMLDGKTDLQWVAFVVPAILFSMLSGLQSAVINARHRVGDLARISVLTAALSLIPAVVLTWIFREHGVAPALAANTLIGLAVGYYYYRKDGNSLAPAGQFSLASLRGPVRELLGFGVPYMASLAVGAGIVALLPILVLHALGPTEVGLFRAASAIAVNYLGLILAAMAQDYFPRIAQAPDDPKVLHAIVNDQLRLVLLLAGPVILGMMGAVPYLVPLLYSHEFAPAAGLLEWQLIGDLFKFSTWAMAFVVMTRVGSATYFVTELVCGLVLLASSWIGMEFLGLPGLGIGFLVAGVLACAIYWLVLYRSTGITWSSGNMILFLMLAAGMALLRVISIAGQPLLNLAGAAVLATGFGLYSLISIANEFGGWRVILARRRGTANG